MSLGRRLKERREEIGMTQEDVGRRVGLSKSTIGKYEKGILSNIPSDNIEKLANALDTSPAYLMGWRTDRSRSAAVPLLGTIAAGTPILAEENITEYFNLDSSIRADFALRVRGDSMIEAGIFPDDIAFFRHQSCLDNGQVGAVLIDNEATLVILWVRLGQVSSVTSRLHCHQIVQADFKKSGCPDQAFQARQELA